MSNLKHSENNPSQELSKIDWESEDKHVIAGAVEDEIIVATAGGKLTKGTTKLAELAKLIDIPAPTDPTDPTNLLTNSGFGVCSNSTLENVGSATVDDDCADDGTANWTTDGSVAFDTDHYEFTADTDADVLYWTTDIASNLTTGKLYEASITVKDGTQASAVLSFGMLTDAQASNHTKSITTTSSFVKHTVVFKADASDAHLGMIAGADWDANIEIKDITLYEVTPGFVADTLAFDGWSKTTTLDVYQEHSGTNTKDGSFYSAKLVPSATSDFLKFVGHRTPLASYYHAYRSKTMALGMWVKTSTASHAKIGIYGQSGGWVYSDYHTGGGNFEWLSLSVTIASDATNIQFSIDCDLSSGIVYASQPMLVFGSVIGEGNYSQPLGEVVWFDANRVALNDYGNVSVSANTEIDIESQSNGAIPKGFKAVNGYIIASCATIEKFIYLGYYDIAIYSQVANIRSISSGWVRDYDNDGSILISSNDTFTEVFIQLKGVQVS